MQVTNKVILPVISIIALAALPIVNWTTGNLRIVVSVIVLLFVPGYTLLAALFPKRGTIRTAERIALSLGLSLAIVPVIGLSLHFTPWGLAINSVLVAVTIFVLLASGISWYRDSRLPAEGRLSFRISLSMPGWHQLGKMDKALSVGLALVLSLLTAVVAYAAFTPNKGENFTEFYILDAQGTTNHYPEKVAYSEPVTILAGVVSHEDIATDYIVEAKVDGVLATTRETGNLARGQQWQEEISFVPQNTGNGQKVEFWLYKKGEVQPYNKDSLHFNLDVSG